MNLKKLHVSGIVIYLTMHLAHGIFRESGDLPVHYFPCMVRLAESIGEALNVGHAIDIEDVVMLNWLSSVKMKENSF
jgi:hypothetical protein